MRELTLQEIQSVGGSGSIVDGSTPVPFTTNLAWAGPAWPSGVLGVISGVPVAWSVGTWIGSQVYVQTENALDMSTGEALHRSLNS